MHRWLALLILLNFSSPVEAQQKPTQASPPPASQRWVLHEVKSETTPTVHMFVLLNTQTGAVYKSNFCQDDLPPKPHENSPITVYERSFWAYERCWVKMELPK